MRRYITAEQATSAVVRQRDDLLEEVKRLRAGEDLEPYPDDRWPTAGQMWHRLLEEGEDQRMLTLSLMIEDGATAMSARMSGFTPPLTMFRNKKETTHA